MSQQRQSGKDLFYLLKDIFSTCSLFKNPLYSHFVNVPKESDSLSSHKELAKSSNKIFPILLESPLSWANGRDILCARHWLLLHRPSVVETIRRALISSLIFILKACSP